MTAAQAALTLLGVTVLACMVMVGTVLERKLRRDKREFTSLARRERLERALVSGDEAAIRPVAARACDEPQAQVDFAITAAKTVDRLVDGNRLVLHRVAIHLGLVHCLIAQLRSSDPIERGRAVFLLGELRFPGTEVVLARLLSDPDPDVRLVAAAELGGMASETSADALIAALMSGGLAPERIIERLGVGWAVPRLVAVLEDQERADSLAPPDREPVSTWRASVARALGVAGDPRAELTLARMLDSPHSEERVAAARALGPCGTRASLPVLIKALDDPVWEVRAQAAKSLRRLPEPSAVPPLEERLSDEAWWVRSNAADTLAELGDAGVAALRRALSHSDRYARERAREALALHGLVRT